MDTPIKINIKPISVNTVWAGKRYKTPAYKKYEAVVLMMLPNKIELPKPPYQINFKFGFSSSASDWDNPIKPNQDIIAKKYKFNDKLIKRAVVEIDMVKKGSEYFEFQLIGI